MALTFSPFLNGIIPAAGSPSFKDPVDTTGDLPSSGNMEGDIRYVTGSNAIYAWDGVSWVPVTSGGGATTVIDKFTLTGTDITNKYVTLSTTPTSPALSVLLVSEGPIQTYTTDYTITTNQLSWNGLALDGVLASGDILTVIYN